MKENTIERLVEYFTENEDDFVEVIESLDDWNGYMGDNRYYEMEMFNEVYADTDPVEIATRCFYGHDADEWHTDSHGYKEYGAFNPNREYFYFNGYGNPVSTDYKDYSGFLDRYFCEEIEEYRDKIDLPEEVEEILDADEDEE